MRIVIECDPATGKVGLEGPLGNKLLCLGVLEAAKKAVLDFDPARQPGVLLAQPRPLPGRPHNGEGG